MNDSCLSDLSIQGQAINLASGNTPNRQQWGGEPRGTIINVLEHANAHNDTMSSTTSNETPDVSSRILTTRVYPNLKNETYVISSSKAATSSSPTVNAPQKPIIDNSIVEESNELQTSRSKEDKSQK